MKRTILVFCDHQVRIQHVSVNTEDEAAFAAHELLGDMRQELKRDVDRSNWLILDGWVSVKLSTEEVL